MAGLQYKFFPTDFFVPTITVDGDHIAAPQLVSFRTREPADLTDSSLQISESVLSVNVVKDKKLVAKVARSSSAAVTPPHKQKKDGGSDAN